MKLIDITGNRYGKLVVIERADSIVPGVTVWKCLCDCGNYTVVRGGNLKSGAVKSCGCTHHQKANTIRKQNLRLYGIYHKMRSRCNNPNCPAYKDYGERGISVCAEWDSSFSVFFEWAMESGYADTLTIERIDVNGNYCPENCKWITKSEQANNRRTCKLFTYNGKTQNLAQWCNELNLSYKNIYSRIFQKGWSFERAISTPVDVNKIRKEFR